MKFATTLLIASASAITLSKPLIHPQTGLAITTTGQHWYGQPPLAMAESAPVEPVENHCTNTNKATGVDQDCSEPGNSAWNTFSTSRTAEPKDAQAAPYPDHTEH